MHLVFSRLENRSCKKHLAIDWLAAVAGEWKWKMLAGWHRKQKALAVGKRGALGCWPAKPETKMPTAGKCAPRVFTSEKFALAFLFAG